MQLADERQQRAAAETSIRENVALEMEDLLRDMQASYKVSNRQDNALVALEFDASSYIVYTKSLKASLS